MIDNEPVIESWPQISETGFEGLRLGSDISQIRGRFGLVGEVMTFRRTEGAELSAQFVDYGIIVTYDDAGSIALIELARPMDPTLCGVRLLDRTEQQVVSDLRSQGILVRERHAASEILILADLGIRLWVLDETVESVSIGNDESE